MAFSSERTPRASSTTGRSPTKGKVEAVSGPGSRSRPVRAAGFNLNWDGAWEVRTHTNANGWSAEFAIPFRTLRFPEAPEQMWRINFQRNIRRRNERAFWSPIPRQYTIYRLSLAGTVSGIRTPTFRNFKVTPYALGNIVQSGERPVDAVLPGDVGLDAKYNLSSSLTLDA